MIELRTTSSIFATALSRTNLRPRGYILNLNLLDRNREDLRCQTVSSPTWWFFYCRFLGDYDVVVLLDTRQP